MTIDLSRLPAPNVVEAIDFETLYAERKEKLISLYPADQQDAIRSTLALDSEPIAIVLQENAYREMNLRQRINDASRAVMLPFSKGTDLDNLAANFEVERLIVKPADETTVPPTPAVMEEDPYFVERSQQAFEGLSVAGPRGAYAFHAHSADGRVADAKAISPDPCDVVVSILATEGDGTAPADLLDIVRDALNDEDVRPVADRVTVQSAEIVTYTIKATIYLDAGPEAEPILQAAVAGADKYRDTKRRIGRDVNRSAIIAALHAEGVKKVNLEFPPEDIPISDTQASYCTGVEIINGGVGG